VEVREFTRDGRMRSNGDGDGRLLGLSHAMRLRLVDPMTKAKDKDNTIIGFSK
jgi:hypothetical protein